MGVSYITGFGVKSCMHPCHMCSTADGLDAPVPGLVVSGPDMSRGDEYSKWLISKGTPPAKCYVDREYSYATNETSLRLNAAAVFAVGFFCRLKSEPEKNEEDFLQQVF